MAGNSKNRKGPWKDSAQPGADKTEGMFGTRHQNALAAQAVRDEVRRRVAKKHNNPAIRPPSRSSGGGPTKGGYKRG